jgi:3,4-dihydroxy 2-butanone 4-phosphate synthase/GTP cyclohydrolase II
MNTRQRKHTSHHGRDGRASVHFDPIEECIEDVRLGKMIIVTDDEDRENEGDLVMAAERVAAEHVNFMLKHGRGLICVPLTAERLHALGITAMVAQNRESFKTAFMVSVDARTGITTGISAHDRARAIQVLAEPRSTAADIVTPGHVFPLQARDGGVLQRAGHTEAAVDLAKLAGLTPAGVICEILNEDGSMARLPQLVKLKKRFHLKLCSIRDLIEYRRAREKLVEKEREVMLPTQFGDFALHLYRTLVDNNHHVALTMGDVRSKENVLVRMHSECLTGDVFHSERCDCGSQLHQAMRLIADEGRGVVVYLRQEGRGIGLAHKIHAYELQEKGLDTVEANEKLGFKADLREYGIGAQILADLGLAGYGLEIVAQLPIKAPPTTHNRRYLETKKRKLGHLL